MKKDLFVLLLSCFVFVLILPMDVFAGGFNVELTPKNTGIAGNKGVDIEIYTGSKDRTAFNTGYEFRLSFADSNPERKCLMTKPTSDISGLAYGTCYSDTAGIFEVYPEVHNYSPASGEWWNMNSSVRTVVRFTDPTVEVTSQPIPSPTPKNLSELENKVSEIEQKVTKQEEDISLLKSLVSKIIAFLDSLWPF